MSNRPKIEQPVHVVFEKICEIEDRDERIAYLKENGNRQVRTILQLAYNDKIILDVPKGKPPFTPCQDHNTPVPLSKAFDNLARIVKGTKLDQVKKETVFISILESIPEETAKILIAAKDGNLVTIQSKKYSKITKSLVEATFPSLLQ
jgi:hypothetical protein